MKTRPLFWVLLSLLVLAGAWFFWHQGNRVVAQKKIVAKPAVVVVHSASTAPKFLTKPPIAAKTANASAAVTNKFAYRLSNTGKPIGELVRDGKAILLENALIDLRNPLNFSIPKNLQAQGDPGAYIVQANGPIDDAFRAMLAAAGATIVSYIPNNAYLVRASSGVADGFAADGFSVIPYEPYYKVQSSLLPFDEKQLPGGTVLNLGLFSDDATATIQQIEKLGGQILAQDSSPFGPIVRVLPPVNNWTALATLPGVQIVEPYRQRVHANDLSRATVGVSTDSTNAAYYTNGVALTGQNVMVEVNDSGIDGNPTTGHPDLRGRVFGAPADLVDTDGHGTHVAGIIAGNGTESTTVTNAEGSINPGVAGQYRGMAPMADLFIQDLDNSDSTLQETPALTNALISNNSWNYDGDSVYDLAAASYDAATRDALPFVTGSQPVLFVFAAGNDGNGDDTTDPGGGSADTIQSPATAKDVITVGALQEFRNITNQVTNADGTVSAVWQPETSTSYRVAGFSSRGDVGIGTEGTYGRFKPDVVAPGTFVVSTRSSQWDIGTYFYQNPTNYDLQEFDNIIVQPDSIWVSGFPEIPNNTVLATIQVTSNADSPEPFPILPIWVGLLSSAGYDFDTTNNMVSIPPDGGAGYLNSILNSESFGVGFNYGVSNTTSQPISFNLFTDVITTNNPGNYFLVLSNLDQSIGTPSTIPGSTGPGPYYRYESGTSMAAADVSGVLALMQSFFTNVWKVAPPSPALLKAMLINGARATGFYNYQAQNSINYEGWGLINLPDSLPPGITTNGSSGVSMFIQDQSPTNALATGDSQTFNVALTTNGLAQPLRVTLAWTDPPGDPVAATKLVNDLNLVVTNLSNPSIVYYGNDIPASSTYNSARGTNSPPVFDDINNVENVYLPAGVGTNFSVTVMGYRVNVNAVTAQTNNSVGAYAPNIVQDYALVISSGNGQVTNAMTVAPQPIVSNPTTDQQITDVTNSSGVLLNQTVGANSPLLGTNTLSFGGTAPENFGASWQVTVGQTNQWHFYVVTNTFGAGFTNAAFVTFDPDTLSIPREGVFADSQANATRPEADIDLYVSTDPTLTNLNPVAISNAVVGTQVGATAAGFFTGASLGRGGTEFVVDTNSQPNNNEVYYVGVKSEDQMASEFGFLSVFTTNAFSALDTNGNQTVNGLLLPLNIPDGSPAHPGIGLVFALAIYPMTVGSVIASDEIMHQNFGDLIGTLNHSDISAVLNNHDSLGNPPGPYSFIYDDSGGNNFVGSQPSDGPGSLRNFTGTQGAGPWILSEVDDSLTQTGSVQQFSLLIQPHQANDISHTNTVASNGWFYDYVDVPPGSTNLTITVTNLGTATLELFVKYGSEPTTNSFDEMTNIIAGTPSAGSITIGPPLTAGRYYYGVYNPSATAQQFISIATVLPPNPVASQVDFTSSGSTTILDDAVTTNSIFVWPGGIISSVDVAIAVQHPRISDLVFHLISPDGTRVLLMENRGGTSTNGAGGTSSIVTNNALTSDFDMTAATNYLAGQTVAGWNVAGSQVSVVTDPTTANGGGSSSNFLALANGAISTNLPTTPGATYTVTFQYRGPGIVGWWRGENSAAVDSIGGNNGTFPNGMGFAAGEVNNCFNLNGTNQIIIVNPSSPANLDVGQGSGFTIEGWIKPTTVSSSELMFEYERALQTYSGADVGVQFGMNHDPNNGNLIPGALTSNIKDIGNGDHIFVSPINLVQAGVWQHVAVSYNTNSGVATLYLNGSPVTQTNLGSFVPDTGFTNLVLGGRTTFSSVAGPSDVFSGDMDEMSIYKRTLSASEVKAIYNANSAGKFDPAEFTNSPSLSLAEAKVSVNGQTPTNLYGNNTNWQIYTTSFTANQSSTPLQIQGIEPGMLLDDMSVVSVVTNYNYLVFTENTNLTTTPIKFAVPPFVPGISSVTNFTVSDFESATAADYASPATVNDESTWNVTGNQVSVLHDPANAQGGSNFLALANGTIINTLPTVAGQTYTLTFADRGPGIVGWWRGEGNANDSIGGNNGVLENGAGFAAGEVGSAFYFDGVSNYVQIPANASLNVGNDAGMTVECWIKPADTSTQRPLVVWTTNNPSTDVSVVLGPLINPANGHYYYLLPADTWDNSEATARLLGGHLVTIRNASENSWVATNVAAFGTPQPNPNIGLNSTNNEATWFWSSGEPVTYTNWSPGQPSGDGTAVNYLDVTSPANIGWNDHTRSDVLEAIAETTSGVDFWMSVAGPGSLYANLLDTTNGSHIIYSAPGILQPNVYQHVALTYDHQTGIAKLYCNGVVVANTNLGIFTPKTSGNVLLGKPFPNITGTSLYDGDMDEVSVYGRALSASEIKAINDNGANGKYDPAEFSVSAPQSLAKAGVSIDGGTQTTFFGANTSWQTTNITFTAAQNGTPLQITGLEPGMLLDSFALSEEGSNNLYYLPEQSLDAYDGENAEGVWTLEIQDDRAGEGLTNTLASWQLRFNYTTSTTSLANNQTVTNSLQPGGIAYYLVNVPTNADFATNFLLTTSGPLNFWFNETAPPSGTGSPGDYLLFNTSVNDSNILSTTSSPTNIVPGGYYYLAVQNTNTFAITNFAVQVNFHLFTVTDLTNGVPQTNSVAPGSFAYYAVNVPTNADIATNILQFATGPVNLLFNQTTLPSGLGAGDVTLLSASAGGSTNLSLAGSPPLVPGTTYFLGVQNTNSVAVNFGIEVNFHFIPTAPITNYPITGITFTNIGGTNGILLTWYAPTNYQFLIQWTRSLSPSPIFWTTVPGVMPTLVSAVGTTGEYQWFDDFSLTGGFGTQKFYRLIAYPPGVPVPPLLVITSVQAFPGGGIQLQWLGSTNYLYDILWSSNLALPTANWNVLSNLTFPPLAYTNGVFTFSDPTGALTGGAAPVKFFQVLELP